MQLSEEQKKIVNHIDGAVLVTAGPGSGKTRVLIERIINIVSKKNGQVLALTFSNKAADEMTERLENRLENSDINRVTAETIHSFCMDVVVNNGNQIGLPDNLSIISNREDKLELLRRIYMSTNSNNLGAILDRIELYKSKFITPEMIDPNHDSLKFINIYDAYNKILLSNRYVDFYDILFYAYRIFNEKPRVAKNYTRMYKYIMVDEAQDLNKSQYKVIKSLTRNFDNLMMVGDPSQSIYGFNGSDSTIFTENFSNDYNPTKYELLNNYRSSSKIIEAANKINSKNKTASIYPIEGEFAIHNFETESDEAAWVLNKINEIIETGSEWIENQVEFENIALIARNRYVFNEILQIFNSQGIPYNLGTNSNKVDSETTEMQIFELGLKILVNPFDELRFQQINTLLNRDIEVVTNNLDELLKNKTNNNTNIKSKIFNEIRNTWNEIEKSVDNFSRSLNRLESFIESLSLDDEYKYLLQNDINLWKDRWKKYIGQTVIGSRSLSDFVNQFLLGKLVDNDLNGISLLTVHGSKGLEYDIVFILGMNEGTFPDYRADNEEKLQEEYNNIFVAITRAKRICYLTYPNIKMMPWGKPKYVKPSEFIEILS